MISFSIILSTRQIIVRLFWYVMPYSRNITRVTLLFGWYFYYFLNRIGFIEQIVLETIITTRAIRKVSSGELLTTQSMRKIIMYKDTYILQVLLNVVIAGIEVLVVSGNTFL
jgi:hypothetical protein